MQALSAIVNLAPAHPHPLATSSGGQRRENGQRKRQERLYAIAPRHKRDQAD